MSGDFSPDQKRYLEGFVSGLSAARAARGSALAKSEPTGPDAIHLKAQDRAVAAGGKLADQEKFKREQDCGQCGYNCQDYSNAIFLRQEERLNLCVPGGKETARMLKTLYTELDAAPAPAPAAPAIVSPALADSAVPSTPSHAAPGRSRDRPVEAMFL